jgi:hypothetical protein
MKERSSVLLLVYIYSIVINYCVYFTWSSLRHGYCFIDACRCTSEVNASFNVVFRSSFIFVQYNNIRWSVGLIVFI